MRRFFPVALGVLLIGGGSLAGARAAAATRPAARPGVVLETSSLEIDFSRHAVTLVQIGARGCFRCELMQPLLQELAQEYRDELLVLHYDAAVDIRPAAHYRVKFLPTQVFLDAGGREWFRHTGFFTKEEIRKVLDGRGLKRSEPGD